MKQNAVNDSFSATQACIVTKKDGVLSLKDGFDTGMETSDDIAIGGLVGAVIGVVGGSYGAPVGSTIDSVDVIDNISPVGKVCEK